MAKDNKGHGSNSKGLAAGRPTQRELSREVKKSAKHPTIDSRITASQKSTGGRYSYGRWDKAKSDFTAAEKAHKGHVASGNSKGIREAQAAMTDARVRMAAESTKGRK